MQQNGCPQIAVFISHGQGLVQWDRLGLFDREVGYYRELSRAAGSMILVSYDTTAAELEDRRARLEPLEVVHNRWGIHYRWFGLLAPFLHRKALRQCNVFRSEQLSGAWTAAIAASLFRKPFVLRCGFVRSLNDLHDNSSRPRRYFNLFLERLCVRAADLIIVTTPSHRQYLAKTHNVPLDRFGLVPNPIDTGRFQPVAEVEKQRGLVVFVGRFSDEKNVGLLIDACRTVPVAHLLLVGSGPQEDELRRRAKGANVEFRGNVPNYDLPTLLNRAEVFVLPSRYEGCPKALLEAMACGLAVVGTDVIGIRDIIEHRVNGLLCESRPPSLAGAISELLSRSDLRRRLGEAARSFVVNHFSQTCSVRLEARMIDQLLQTKERVPCR